MLPVRKLILGISILFLWICPAYGQWVAPSYLYQAIAQNADYLIEVKVASVDDWKRGELQGAGGPTRRFSINMKGLVVNGRKEGPWATGRKVTISVNSCDRYPLGTRPIWIEGPPWTAKPRPGEQMLVALRRGKGSSLQPFSILPMTYKPDLQRVLRQKKELDRLLELIDESGMFKKEAKRQRPAWQAMNPQARVRSTYGWTLQLPYSADMPIMALDIVVFPAYFQQPTSNGLHAPDYRQSEHIGTFLGNSVYWYRDLNSMKDLPFADEPSAKIREAIRKQLGQWEDEVRKTIPLPPLKWYPTSRDGLEFSVTAPDKPITRGSDFHVWAWVRNTTDQPMKVGDIEAFTPGIGLPRHFAKLELQIEKRKFRSTFSSELHQAMVQKSVVRLLPGESRFWMISANCWQARKLLATVQSSMKTVDSTRLLFRWNGAEVPLNLLLYDPKAKAAEFLIGDMRYENGRGVVKPSNIPALPKETSFAEIEKMMQSVDFRARYAAMRHLRKIYRPYSRTAPTGEQTLGFLKQALNDPYWGTQSIALDFIRYRGGQFSATLRPLFVSLIKNSTCRRVQIDALRVLPYEPSIKEVLPAAEALFAQAPEELVARKFGEEYRKYKTPEVIEILKRGTKSPNPTTRLWAYALLAKYRPDVKSYATAYVTALRKMLNSNEPMPYQAGPKYQAYRTIECVGQIATPIAPLLARQLQSKDKGIRLQASRVILYCPTDQEDVLKGLIAGLTDAVFPNDIPSNCLSALSKLGPKARSAVPVMLTLLKQQLQPKPPMHIYSILRAFEKIDPSNEKALPILIALLKKANEKGRPPDSLIIAIGLYGPRAQPAAKELVRTLRTPKHPKDHPYYIDKAIWALGQIGPEAGPEAIKAVKERLKSVFGETAKRALLRLAPKDPNRIPPPDKQYVSKLNVLF
jgi:HEAT repeat protein